MSLTNTYQEYSEFEVEKFLIKTKGDTKHKESGAIGSAEETLNVRSIVKKYKGVEAKSRTKGAGNGETKFSLHMNYETYKKLYGMNQSELVDGVSAYGRKSAHEEFSITMLILDEDNERKLKAYPRCIIKTEPSNKIENGGDEVKEIEITVSLMPDEYGNCMYEALEDEIEDELKGKWLESFTPADAHVQEA